MNNIEDYKEQAEHYKQRLDKVEKYHSDQRTQEKINNLSGGKMLMVAFGVLVLYAFFPWREKEYTDVHFGLAIAGFIGGFVMWLKGKD